MPYNLIDTRVNNYGLLYSDPYVTYDSLLAFEGILNNNFPTINYSLEVLSERTGNRGRRECLVRMSFDEFPASSFFIYCFQTEGGGRWNLITNGEDEARLQWRKHDDWSVDLNELRPCLDFQHEFERSLDGDLTNKECYIFSFYKRNETDNDIVISAIYPTQAQEVEINSTSNKSIQFSYDDIRSAFQNGMSATQKGNRELIIHFKPQFLLWYMINRDRLHISTLEEFNREFERINVDNTPRIITTGSIDSSIPRNKIIYGAPGTGKSFELREQATATGFDEDNVIRVTFHPNYSYQQFVGSYKPTPIYKNILEEGAVLYGSDKTTELDNNQKREPLIDYTFVPGPFLKLLVQSLRNEDQNYLLIIEEINRAPVSSVFGDVFQLLDRDANGVSEYSITFNEEAQSFLRANGIPHTEIKIPGNFFIWATMNSADQGVMPLDAAFKRRWAFEYLPLDKKQDIVADRQINFQGETYNWNEFRTKINERLKAIGVAEDKLIGPFFMSQYELSDENAIKNKLLLYLRDDVVRHNPESLFNKKTYSDIIAKYDNGDQVFVGLEFSVENDQSEAQE